MLVPGLRSLLLAAVLVQATAAAGSPLQFEYVTSFGSEGTGPGQFKYIEDFAFSRDGHLVATDASHAFVQVFDKHTGALLARFGGKGDAEHHLEKPEGVAVDESGNVFVADYATGFIKKYDPAFGWVMTFSEYGSELGQNMKSEFMDIHGGRLYLPDAGNHRVNVFDLTGKPLFHFGGIGTAPGTFNTPEAAKFSRDGKLYVSDLKNDRIQVFDADGRFLTSFGRTGSEPGEFRTPVGLAFDKDDNLYVTESGNARVQVFDKTGKVIAHWGQKGSGPGEFANLHGIIVDQTNGFVYVADTGNHRIQVFRPVNAAGTRAALPSR